MYPVILAIHVTAATIWTGGHIVLFWAILLPALRSRDHAKILEFERRFEKIGIPALLALVATGLWMAWRQVPDISLWFSFSTAVSRTVTVKLVLLFLTAALALHARLKLIPGLTEKNLKALAVHIAIVTALSVAFVLTGIWHRFGGIW